MRISIAVLIIALIGFSYGLATEQNSRAEDTRQFLEGFFVGSLHDNSSDINACIDDSSSVLNLTEAVMKDLQDGNMIHFAEHLKKLLNAVPATVSQCKKAPAELKKYEQWGHVLTNFTKFERMVATALLHYKTNITNDASSAISDWTAHKFSASGYELGDMLYILFELCAPAIGDSLDDGIVFLTAFYKQAFKIDLSLNTCKASIETQWDVIISAIQKLETLDIAKIQEAIIELIAAYPALIEAFQNCESAWPQLEQGLLQLKTFVDEADRLPWAITQALTFNIIRVTSDINSLKSAFNSTPQDFAKGGKASGDLVELLLTKLKLFLSENELIKEEF